MVPPERFLPQLADTITNAKCSPDGKRVAIAWLMGQVEAKTLSSVSDIEALLRVCASAVKDKKNDVRADGEALVAAIVEVCAHGDVQAAVGGLDSTTRAAATEVLQKHMSMGPPAAAGVPRIPSGAALRGDEGGARPLTARGGGGPAGHKRGSQSRGGTSQGSTAASVGGGLSVDAGDACLLMVNDRKEDRARKVLLVCVWGGVLEWGAFLEWGGVCQGTCCCKACCTTIMYPLHTNTRSHTHKKTPPTPTAPPTSACQRWQIRATTG